MNAQKTLDLLPSKVVPDASDYGMVGVSREAFFATVGKMDVHPSLAGQNYDPVLGYVSKWKTPYGDVVGATVGGTHLSETAYMVSCEFFERNRAAIAKATGGAA